MVVAVEAILGYAGAGHVNPSGDGMWSRSRTLVERRFDDGEVERGAAHVDTECGSGLSQRRFDIPERDGGAESRGQRTRRHPTDGRSILLGGRSGTRPTPPAADHTHKPLVRRAFG